MFLNYKPRAAKLTPAPHYLSWKRVYSEHTDYHRSDCFGTIIVK
ncbi:carbohydrate-binding family 9-like protein [Paenibacillus sp. YIM B09110]